jgi:hypothetical protein
LFLATEPLISIYVWRAVFLSLTTGDGVETRQAAVRKCLRLFQWWAKKGNGPTLKNAKAAPMFVP